MAAHKINPVALLNLKTMLNDGDAVTVRVVAHSTAGCGSRKLEVLGIGNDAKGAPAIVDITYWVAGVTGDRFDSDKGLIVIRGSGFNARQALVEGLADALGLSLRLNGQA